MIRSESVSMIESLIELIAEQIVPAQKRDVVIPKLTDYLSKILKLVQSLIDNNQSEIILSL